MSGFAPQRPAPASPNNRYNRTSGLSDEFLKAAILSNSDLILRHWCPMLHTQLGANLGLHLVIMLSARGYAAAACCPSYGVLIEGPRRPDTLGALRSLLDDTARIISQDAAGLWNTGWHARTANGTMVAIEYYPGDPPPAWHRANQQAAPMTNLRTGQYVNGVHGGSGG